MRWSDIPFHPSDRMLRQFGLLGLTFLGVMGLWHGYRHGLTPATLALVGAGLLAGGLGTFAPRLLRPVFVAWMVLAFPIGWTISQLVLLFVYYAILTPMGLVMRLLGRDALRLRLDPNQTTFWIPKPATHDVRRYYRQF